MKLTFKKDDILEKLRTNREEHLNIMQEAQKGYRERWREMLVVQLADLNAGKPVAAGLHLAIPENHVDDFDRAIEMFEMTTDGEITLDDGAFQSFVRNKWEWHRHFLAANLEYSETAQTLSNALPG